MPGIARVRIDYATSHSKSDTHVSPSQTMYVSGSSKVFVEGKPAAFKGSKSACGDEAIEGSSKVFIEGKCVHRKGDKMSSHEGTYSQSVCAQGSSKVFSN